MKNRILQNKVYLYLTEFFAGMSVIDDIIGDEVSYYKAVYDEKGIKGLLEELQ